MSQKNIFIGFSINPELSFQSELNEDKSILSDYSFNLSGSAINIWKALQAFEQQGTVLGILPKVTIVDKDALIMRNILNTLIEEAKLDMLAIHCMNRPNFAITHLVLNRTAGEKGTIDEELALEQMQRFNISSGLRIATGIRPSEIRLAKNLLGDQKGFRAVNLKPEILKSKDLMNEILPSIDFLFMNQEEHKKCFMNFQELHAAGVEFVAVTLSENGVAWSMKEDTPTQAYVEGEKQSVKTFSTGCGDWFFGSFIGALLSIKAPVGKLEHDHFAKAVVIANKVAAKKATFKGGSLGPDAEMVKKIIESVQ